MKYYIAIIVAVLCMVSCSNHSADWSVLLQVDSFIEQYPDSALTVLERIDVAELTSNEERAKYALLLSMALDKNYVDKTDFEMLQPAIDYYQHHGTATDKLRTYYYEGRIYFNKGDKASASIRFSKALNEGKESKDILTKARTHFAQANIYNSLYKWDSYIEENKRAARYFKGAGLQNSYANCLIHIINGYNLIQDEENATKHIKQCELILDSISINRKNEFYITLLNHVAVNNKIEAITTTLDSYLSTVPTEKLDWISIANAYMLLNDFEMALTYIQRHQVGSNIKQDIRYYALIPKIYEKNSLPDKALNAYLHHASLTDSIDLATYGQTTLFMEEYHKSELQAIKEQEKTKNITLLSLIITLALLSLCLGIRMRLIERTKQKEHLEIEKENYRLQCQQIEEERDSLTRLLAKREELSETTQQNLTERVALLNRFFATYIKSNEEHDYTVNEEIKKMVKDRESFLNSNRLSFTSSHPQFIHYLEERGLNEWEINYCCLYTLGLNGKEIGTYIKLRSHYNQSSIIREKLGIGEHDTNLGIYLRQLMRRLPSE